MSSKCKKILTDSGFSSLDADKTIDKIRNSNKSFDELADDILRSQDKESFHPFNRDRSEELGNSYINALKEVAGNLKHPFKVMRDFLGGDMAGATQKAQSRWINVLARYVGETGVSQRDFFTLIEGGFIGDKYKGFRQNFIREAFNDTDISVTGDVLATKLANAVKRQWRMDILEANQYGAGIKFKNNWTVHQTHMQDKLLKHGPGEWKTEIMRNIDEEATIENIRYFYPETRDISDAEFELDKFLDEAYEHMVGATDEGQGILAETFQLHRIFEFKSADHLIDYNAKFGHENIAHAIMENQNMFQKYLEIGNMMGYGTVDVKPILNPAPDGPIEYKEIFSPILETRKMFQAMKDMGKLSPHEHSQLSAILRDLTGDNSVVGSPKRAAMVQDYIAWQSMAVLGKSMFQTVSDIGSAGIMLHLQGLKPGQGYYGMITKTIKQLTGQLSGKEKKLAFQALHTFTDGTLMNNASKIHPDQKRAGWLAKGANAMFHFSGLNAVTNAMRTGYANMSANIMANKLSIKWDDLDALYKTEFLEKAEITKQDWEHLQAIGSFNSKIWKKDANKLENFITMDHILERGKELKIPGTVKLARKIDNYFIQGSRSAIPEAKAIDRALLFGNHDRGSWLDVTRRLAVVFRSYQSQLVRNLYPAIQKLGLPSVVHIIPYVALGYTSMALRELVKGKEPPPPDPETFIKAMVHSGLAPIIGDYVAGEYANYDPDIGEVIGGFSYSKFKGFGELMVGLWTGDTDAADIFNSIRYNTPFANLYFTEFAVNYGMHYGVMEALRPNYLNSLEAQAASQGTDFFYEPSNLWG